MAASQLDNGRETQQKREAAHVDLAKVQGRAAGQHLGSGEVLKG